MRILLLVAGVLIVPLAVMLFLQWPLRAWIQNYSREVNDLGQIIFAFYVAVAVFAASRAGCHLAAGIRPAGDPSNPKPWQAWFLFLCVVPWALFMLWASIGTISQSVMGLERFAETLTPGYFLIQLAMGFLLLLVLAAGVASVWRAARKPS